MSIQKKPDSYIRTPSTKIIQDIRKKMIDWGRNHYQNFPWRSTNNPFHALIAEVMLQRTRAEQVVLVYNLFSKRYLSPCESAHDDPEKILELLRPLGLRWRAKKMIELFKVLASQEGKIPLDFKELISLPGVGHYSASAFLSLHSGIRATIVDNNVVRIWGRVFGFKTNSETRRKRWFLNLIEKLTPAVNFREFNYAVLDHTRKVCRPKPLCKTCPLAILCIYYVESLK